MTWALNAPVKTEFTWEYDKARSDLLALYEKGKRQQWNAVDRIDWKQDLDPENPMLLPDETISLYGSDAVEPVLPEADSRSAPLSHRRCKFRSSCTANKAR